MLIKINSYCRRFIGIMTSKLWRNIFSNPRPLVKVCAWCPKDEYPSLKKGEEYTHGMCRRHYRELSSKKDLALSLLITEFIENTKNSLDKKSRKSLKRLHARIRFHLRKLSSSTHSHPFSKLRKIS